MAARQRVAALLRQAVQGKCAPRSTDADVIGAPIRQGQRWGGGSSGRQPFTRRVHTEPPPTHIATPVEAAQITRRNGVTAGVLLAAAGATYYTAVARDQGAAVKPPSEQHLVNWSGTHECVVEDFYQPESLPELEALVKQAHASGQKLRCVGSALSPNGIAFQKAGMVSLSLMDKILAVDKASGRVTVQAGARVAEVALALRQQGLSLANYASIREQTMGGLTQVSAHGTGARVPPLDDSVVGIKLVTPALGTLDLSADTEPELFRLARVGLGCLGVAAELTVQCVPAHRLAEETFVSTPAEVAKHHKRRLAQYKHLRYMWIPYTDAVVVVQSNELVPGSKEEAEALAAEAAGGRFSEDQRLQPWRELLTRHCGMAAEEVATMNFAQCRDILLYKAPLDPRWVAKVNAAEAEFWRRSEGLRVGWSDEILGFECGGQQWVQEVALPAGTGAEPSGADLAYMGDLYKLIKKHKVAAPAPIEQRWTSGSASLMSPSYGSPESLHTWVGIIMFLPEAEAERQAVTAAFVEYGRLVERQLMEKYSAVHHWAKLEQPLDGEDLKRRRALLAARYPLSAFAAARARVDPKNILGNGLVDTLLSPNAPTQEA